MGKSKITYEKVSKKRPASGNGFTCEVCDANIEGMPEWTAHQANCARKKEIARRESQRRAAAAAAAEAET